MSARAKRPTDVLLVDDDPSLLAVLTLELRRSGLTVVACPSPAGALAELRRRPFRWLVTDAQMAPEDGFFLADEAKKLAPGLRVAMISAVCTEHDAAGGPIERVFSKPVSVEALVAFLGHAPAPRGAHLL